MKKSVKISGIFIYIFIVLISFQPLQVMSQDEILTIGIDEDYPPQEFYSNNGPTGFNIDLMNEVAAEINKEPVYFPMPWVDVVESLKNGSVDVINAVNTAERREFFDFSRPFLNISQQIFVRNDWSGIKTIEDLDGHTVAVQENDVGHEYLVEHNSSAIIVTVPDQEQALDKLVNNEVAAVFGNYHTILYYIHQKNLEQEIKPIGQSIDIGGYCFAVQKGNQALLTQLNQGLAIQFDNGNYEEIYTTWYGTSLPGNPQIIRWIIIGIFAAISLFGLLSLWNYSLHKQISKKQKELEKNQQLLIQQEKIKSLGYLAGGIAHDFNNLLAIILGNLSLFKLNTDSSSENYKFIQESELAIAQAKKLANQLLTFSKGGKPIKKITSLEPLLNRVIQFTMSGSNCTLQTEIGDDLPLVNIDPDQISQVIQNILLNAQQAMQKGGEIYFSAKKIALDKKNSLNLPKGQYILILIKDEGKGIPSHELNHIFDPYFTTRKEGTGLGLAIAYSVIQNHQGTIKIKSIVNQGTDVYIYIPGLPDSKFDLELELKSEINHSIGDIPIIRDANILIMDDDAQIRTFIRNALEIHHVNVHLASSGEEALKIYKQKFNSKNPIDLVILDVIVPGKMDGKTCFLALKQFDPEIKAIVSSGYSHEDVMSQYKDIGFVDVLPKPFSITVLLHKISTHLKNNHKSNISENKTSNF